MREILFRGKRTDNGEWLEGWYQPPVEVTHCGGRKESLSASLAFIGRDGFLEDAYIIPETIGQLTGLTDKNGKKIFEGDIISTENGTFANTGMGHVLFYKGMWTSFYGQDALGRDCFDELHTVCNSREVIGNIHDNPELLEVTDNA